jgi:hypothetical protein
LDTVPQKIEALLDRGRAPFQNVSYCVVRFAGGFQLQQSAVVIIGPFAPVVPLQATTQLGAFNSPASPAPLD